jgi:hypothetical protein
VIILVPFRVTHHKIADEPDENTRYKEHTTDVSGQNRDPDDQVFGQPKCDQ